MSKTAMLAATEPICLGDQTAAAYDAYSAAFLNQVDGEPCDLRLAAPVSGEVDRQIWARLDGELVALRATGAERVRILDAGCGPGLWLIQLAQRARQLGFTVIEGQGFDLSPEMIIQASRLALDVVDDRIALRFAVGDIASATQAFRDGCFDLTLCLYNVLNHVPPPLLGAVARELARLTRRALLLTVRTVQGPPTLYVQPLDHARAFHQDDIGDRIDIVMGDGRHHAIASHLFAAEELRGLFAPHIGIAELVGLDIFRRRFATHPHWGAGHRVAGPPAPALDALERHYSADPAFLDQAAHLLLVGLTQHRISG